MTFTLDLDRFFDFLTRFSFIFGFGGMRYVSSRKRPKNEDFLCFGFSTDLHIRFSSARDNGDAGDGRCAPMRRVTLSVRFGIFRSGPPSGGRALTCLSVCLSAKT